MKGMRIIFSEVENYKIGYSADTSLIYTMNDVIEKEQNTVSSEVSSDGLKYQLMYCRRGGRTNAFCSIKVINTKNYPVSLNLCNSIGGAINDGAINSSGGKHSIGNYGCTVAMGASRGGRTGLEVGNPELSSFYNVAAASTVILPGASFRGLIQIAGVYPDDIAFKELSFTSTILDIENTKILKKIIIKFTNLNILILPELLQEI